MSKKWMKVTRMSEQELPQELSDSIMDYPEHDAYHP
jgi:hypothetical protein